MADDKTEPGHADPDPADASGATEVGAASGAQRVIDLFGGIRPMATKLGVPVTTVQGWKERQAIPEARHDEILDAAARHGIALSEDDLGSAPQASAAPAGESAARGEGDAPAPADALPAADARGGHEQELSVGVAWASLGIALAALALALFFHFWEPDGGASGLEARLEALESAPPAEAAADPGALDQLRSGVTDLAASVKEVQAGLADLEKRADALTESGPPAQEATIDPAALDQLQSQVADLGASVADLRAGLTDLKAGTDAAAEPGPSAPDFTPQIEALSARVEAIESTPGTEAGDAGLVERLASLAEEVKTIKASLPDPSALEQLTARVDALGTDLKSAQTEAADPAAVDEVKASVDRLTADSQTLGQRLAAIEGSLAEVQAQTDAGVPGEGGAAGRPAALVFAVGQLADKVTRSGPFEDALRPVEALAGTGTDAEAALGVLRPLATGGVPTLTELRAEFEATARAVAKAAALPEGDDLIDRIVGRVTTLVTVRPVGPGAEGDTPGAILARAESYLGAGDLAAAVAELESLNGQAREAAEPWLARARARLAAAAAVADLQTWAITGLGPASGSAGDSRSPSPDASSEPEAAPAPASADGG